MIVCPECGADDMMCSWWVKEAPWGLCVCFSCKHEWRQIDPEADPVEVTYG